MFNLSKKMIVVTGAAGLLGQQHTKALLDAGGYVFMVDINANALEKAKSSFEKYDRLHTYIADITKEAEVKACVDEVISLTEAEHELVLINNAALDPKVKSANDETNLSRLENFPQLQWDLEIAVGLTGAMLFCKHLGTHMAKRGSGNIINIASDLGIIAPNQNLYKVNGKTDAQQPVKPITYSVIKHGLIGLTKYIATYWATHGVRCNALAPGGMQFHQHETFVQALSDLIPMGRMAQHNEYAGAIVFLASDASSYMNGHTLVMDGGRTIW